MNTKDIVRRYGTGFRAPVLSGEATLERRFTSRWGSSESGQVAWRLLRAAYCEPHRRFHTLRHIEECLRLVDQYAAIVGWEQVPQDLELGLWFHDVIYEPGARDNEQRSAELFQALAAGARLKTEVIESASALILETKNHEACGVLLSGIMCDCDLWILGSPWERYREYARQVREEHARYSDWEYRWGRLRFLRGMLKSKHVFANPLFEETFGERARSNMQDELKVLSAGRRRCLAG